MFTAPIDYVPEPATSLQPDLVVVEDSEVGEVQLTRTPVLVVEVLSPSTRRHDLGSKRLAYAAAGVPVYWLIDPDPPVTVTALRLAGDDYEPMVEVRGEELFMVEEPFPVSFVPARLLDI